MVDRRTGMSRRGRSKVESGTCNVCSAPCSSCMHRNAGFTGSKPDESSDENSHGVVASQCSFNEDDPLLSFRGKALGGSQNTASEASNLVNSNHDTSCENAEMVGKTVENILLYKADEPNTSAMSETERESDSADSEDVNVCDICGDAGREDLLAICSRCSDGAEHTYCMRVMLQKVPEGDWLCEECKFAEEAERQNLESKRKREIEANVNKQSSGKRHIDKPEAAPDAKRQAVEAPTGSPKRPVLPRVSALSRQTSIKGLEKTTRKLDHHSSFNSHSSDDTESTRSNDSQLQFPKGSFFKSNSFNSSSSRPKVRSVDDAMHKEGFSKNLGRSMSSRCIDVGGSSCNDSKVKGSNQPKDRSTEANPSASTVEQKLISRGNSSSSYANNTRDWKGLVSDGKQGCLAKQARHLSRTYAVRDTSTNEKCTASEAKRKNELANVDGLPRSREPREAGEKSKDAVGIRQRPDLLPGLKGLPPQKGQNLEPTETSCAPGSNLSTARNIKEDINKGNRLRAAVDAALRRKSCFGKNRGLEQSDLPSVSNVDSSCDKAFQNLPSKVPVVRDWPVGLQGLQGGHPNVGKDKQTIAVNGNQITLAGADPMDASQSVEPEVRLPSVKPVMKDLPVVTPSVLSTISAIPEHEYIWQGDMEAQKSRNLSAVHCGMQAYRSTLSSPKVVEVVKQFPVKLTLNEVPRLSTWPAQFQDIGAKEHHVALFFFAKDIESYEKSYKPLVDNMIQKDLALKGILEGVELLIFASNQLPRNCQRWNMLYFLWGVFRGKKEKCSIPLKNKPLPGYNVGKASYTHENPSNGESSNNRASSRMQSCMKEENAKEDEVGGAVEKEKACCVSYGDSGAVEETEEGEIGDSFG